ncbi:methylenetetrahydrofolate--tRNA-(uracil(54)-C(5))-methyltransferase (FADH(2)-oxidizing) TrmFO [Sandaracinobacteroides hominis]|uniref:methylenetetrahydrofolate--tRNA-(uracil(54)- C(5))-methyltransferase (FADH(2)-oxidizing) TrmFO n=1 Tax=Sandaracinobacteroides hominis TaxID=2780086 RepID=UPI0018F2A4CD|nr:methylenetetrahydrofolate--tRNA-(uracil(54)-C(5))-methyltransferase (FADH(2)-oxidizing) TrmFO [Sandaracinobacteroides hominis]
MTDTVHIIGGGLAGSEAAWQLAQRGVPVVLHEMRGGGGMTPAHQTDGLAELVCSNSFRSDDALHNAVGLLHREMRALGSLVMRAADAAQVPAGSALAVDRDVFSEAVTKALTEHPLVTIRREEIHAPDPDWKHILIATGPLTSAPLAGFIQQLTGEEHLAFFDAIAPIVHSDSIDMGVAWRQSRYDKRADGSLLPPGEGDYINCPMDKPDYNAFVQALLDGEKGEFKEWERDTPYFEGCMPIEVMAERGLNTLRFGPMKPIGLKDPRKERGAWAVVQLRQDNASGTLMNMVGFQTKLKHAEQVRIFRTIPGLQNAEFARLGGLHRNSFIRSPILLDPTLRLGADLRISFAGQITGCEGYVESSAVGLMAGIFLTERVHGRRPLPPPRETALGSLLAHITGEAVAESFQPMNINFGLFPDIAGAAKGRDRKAALSARAAEALGGWLSTVKAA